MSEPKTYPAALNPAPRVGRLAKIGNAYEDSLSRSQRNAELAAMPKGSRDLGRILAAERKIARSPRKLAAYDLEQARKLPAFLRSVRVREVEAQIAALAVRKARAVRIPTDPTRSRDRGTRIAARVRAIANAWQQVNAQAGAANIEK